MTGGYAAAQERGPAEAGRKVRRASATTEVQHDGDSLGLELPEVSEHRLLLAETSEVSPVQRRLGAPKVDQASVPSSAVVVFRKARLSLEFDAGCASKGEMECRRDCEGVVHREAEGKGPATRGTHRQARPGGWGREARDIFERFAERRGPPGLAQGGRLDHEVWARWRGRPTIF